MRFLASTLDAVKQAEAGWGMGWGAAERRSGWCELTSAPDQAQPRSRRHSPGKHAILFGDPHFTSFSGGNYDINGRVNFFYNIITDANFHWNAKFVSRNPRGHGSMHTYIGMHFRAVSERPSLRRFPRMPTPRLITHPPVSKCLSGLVPPVLNLSAVTIPGAGDWERPQWVSCILAAWDRGHAVG